MSVLTKDTVLLYTHNSSSVTSCWRAKTNTGMGGRVQVGTLLGRGGELPRHEFSMKCFKKRFYTKPMVPCIDWPSYCCTVPAVLRFLNLTALCLKCLSPNPLSHKRGRRLQTPALCGPGNHCASCRPFCPDSFYFPCPGFPQARF